MTRENLVIQPYMILGLGCGAAAKTFALKSKADENVLN